MVTTLRLPDSEFACTAIPALTVWRFSDAPMWLQAYSDHGGDEEWIVFVPRALLEDEEVRDAVARLTSPGALPGSRDCNTRDIPEGAVYVLAH